MNTRDIVVTIYNTLASDPELLSLLNLENASSKDIEKNILKLRQSDLPLEKSLRLAIWHTTPTSLNKRVERRVVTVEIQIPIDVQRTKGLAFQLADRIQILLDKLPVGTGLAKAPVLYDLASSVGWYRASVPFIYNFINR